MNSPPNIAALQGGLIVSCQALPHEPLHSAFIMGRMALAAHAFAGYACAGTIPYFMPSA
ncbi:hypothetical protein [Rappaport israeli]|uniref:hypothetical protein n=1 Tax=Rappaport israeli TaxID=1839807 RepID=UPI000B2851FA|nr:hypothetical protein [Rappaport israeli]